MKNIKGHRLLALLISLAMLLPMVIPASLVYATEETTEPPETTEATEATEATEDAVEEVPTETLPSSGEQTVNAGQTIAASKVWDFSDESQLSDFSLYQSADSAFTVVDGVLKPSGTGGEQKAILNTAPKGFHTVSVDLIPGESGVIYGGLYFGASNAANAQDAINSQVFLIKSDYSGWTDAPNRIDIIQGQFNNGWRSISTKISETGNGNNLFSGGTKQALNLKLTFGYSTVLLTLSLKSNSSKYVQYMYEYDAADLQGQIGLRTISSDTCFDNLKFVYEETLPAGTLIWDLNSAAQATDFTIPEGDGKASFSGSYLLAQGTSNSIHHQKLITLERDLKNIQSISFDIRSGTTSRNWGGICLYNDTETFTVNAGSYWNTQANYNDCLIQMTGVDNVSTADFFTTGTSRTRNNINVTLTFADDTVTATVTRLTDEPLTMTHSAPFTMTGWEGKLGFWVHGSQVMYDNLKIVYDTNAKVTTTYNLALNSSEADQFTVPDGSGSASLGSTGLVVQGTSASIHHQKLVSLNQTFKNIKSISYTQLSGTTARNWGGISLFNDTSQFNVDTGSYWNTSAYYDYCRIMMTGSVVVDVADFFATGTNRKRDNIDVKLEFEDGMINATVTARTTDRKTMTANTSFDMENWEGQLGFWVNGSRVEYRNLKVVCEEDVPWYIDGPSQKQSIPQDSVNYDNTGYNFSTNSNTWKLLEDVNSTPYTLEAWVKIPKGVADGTTGIIVGNATRAPRIYMQLASGGRLQLTYGMENANLSTTTKSYAVDVDMRIGQWVHVAYTCDVANDTVICYINGFAAQTWQQAGLQAVTIPDHVMPENLFQVGSSSLLGWVADVRMWDRALTADEINASMKTQYTQPREDLLFNAPLNEKVDNTFVDLSGNENSVVPWTNAQNLVAETHEPGSYSIVVIPDQQILSHYSPDVLNNMYQWIADNREKENIQMVLNVGDMADNCGNITQWENSKAAWELLPSDLPFIAVPGNHDYDINDGWDDGYGKRQYLTLLSKYFPLSMYESYATDFGALSRDQGLADNSGNLWQAFEVNGNKYLVLALEYVPRDDAIAWANEVIAQHPNHQVIMITHKHLNNTGNVTGKLWPSLLSLHENVIMAFSGHASYPSVFRRTDIGENGNSVHQMLMDVQSTDTSQRLGMVGILRFNEDGTRCDVSYYSTRLGMYDSNSTFTLELPKQENKYDALVGLNSYETVTEAVANANGEIVKILNDTDEAITINSDVTIDLAGYTLSNVTVAEGVKLNLIDSTADYSGTKGSATVTGTVEKLTQNGDDKYMVIGENGVYAPHKYYVGITHVSLDTNVTGFGYKARFYGDAAVQAQIASIGYDLWLTEDRVVTRTLDKFQNVVTLRLKNFLVESYGETPVNAKAVITLTDGTKLESAVNSYSMRSMIELLNDSAADFEVAQLQNVAMFIKKNPVMETWDVANILAVLQPVTNVQAITVADQSMTLVDGTTGTFTLNGAYQFTVQDTEQTVAYSDYADWTADYYITMDKEAADGLYLAGNYGDYGWIAIPVESGKTYTNVPVVQTLLGTSLTYEEMVTDVVSFSCGVADTQSLNTGATVTVELRLTNLENPEEILTLNTTTLTLA